MKNTLDGINGRINIEEENLTAQQKKLAKMKPKKEKRKCISELWHNFKWTSKHVMGVPKPKKREGRWKTKQNWKNTSQRFSKCDETSKPTDLRNSQTTTTRNVKYIHQDTSQSNCSKPGVKGKILKIRKKNNMYNIFTKEHNRDSRFFNRNNESEWTME